MPMIPGLCRLKQENIGLKTHLYYIIRVRPIQAAELLTMKNRDGVQ